MRGVGWQGWGSNVMGTMRWVPGSLLERAKCAGWEGECSWETEQLFCCKK